MHKRRNGLELARKRKGKGENRKVAAKRKGRTLETPTFKSL